MANLNNFPPTPSETYSDDDQDIYKSPADNYSTSVLASDEASNDANDQYKYSTENLDGQKNNDNPVQNAHVNYNYQIQQYFSANILPDTISRYDHNNIYQQGINNDLIQPYSVANFDFSNDTSRFTRNKTVASEEVQYQKNMAAENLIKTEQTIEREPGEIVRTTENRPNFSAEYLMRPPDSESIAAAAVTARKNRNKRRTRIKFEQEQLDLLEASFERTHYPDVNVVDRLSEVLKINTDKICIWFQNRRAKFKRAKKPSDNRTSSDQLINFPENHLDLLETAQKELLAKRDQQQADQSEREANNETPKSAYNESVSENNQNSNTSCKSGNSESFFDESNASTNNETSNNNLNSSNQPRILKLPINYSHSQQIFRPHMLMDQNQFYQPETKSEFENIGFYKYGAKHPVEPVAQERTFLSPTYTTDSRSDSPDSESSASPDASEQSQDSLNNNKNYSQNYPEFYAQHQQQELQQFHDQTDSYSNYYQQGIFNPYTGNQNYYANASFRHQIPGGAEYTAPQLSFNGNIFQPYIDCNSSAQQQQQQQQNTNLYYRSYYNE